MTKKYSKNTPKIDIEKAIDGREDDIKNVIDSFLNLKDTRYAHNVIYSLAEIFFLVLCAQICGHDSFREYEFYGHLKVDFLRRFLPYKNGIPSHTTIGAILAIFLPDELEARFQKSMELILSIKAKDDDAILESDMPEIDSVAIDGKRHRGVKKSDKDDELLTVVSAFSTKREVTLGQVKVADKSNEITAIPELLDSLSIAGQVVTIDAAGCQVGIAKQIRSKKADYILSLKGNQESLYNDVIRFFENPEYVGKGSVFEISNKGHGRIETRKCTVVGSLLIPDEFKKWEGLQTVVKLESTRIVKEKVHNETRYYISSLPPDPKLILSGIRHHWGIENKTHWVLDVVFREDDRIIWNTNIAYNESIIRRFALNLLKSYQTVAIPIVRSEKIALKTLRKILIVDDNRMEKLLCCF